MMSRRGGSRLRPSGRFLGLVFEFRTHEEDDDLYEATKVKHLIHGILHFLASLPASSFFVRLESPFLRPDPRVP